MAPVRLPNAFSVCGHRVLFYYGAGSHLAQAILAQGEAEFLAQALLAIPVYTYALFLSAMMVLPRDGHALSHPGFLLL